LALHHGGPIAIGYYPHDYEAAAARLRAAERQAAREEAARADEQAKAAAAARALADLAAKRKVDEAAAAERERLKKARLAKRKKLKVKPPGWAAFEHLKTLGANYEQQIRLLFKNGGKNPHKQEGYWLLNEPVLNRIFHIICHHRGEGITWQIHLLNTKFPHRRQYVRKWVWGHEAQIRQLALEFWLSYPYEARKLAAKTLIKSRREFVSTYKSKYRKAPSRGIWLASIKERLVG
jgi:hypothetical protein